MISRALLCLTMLACAPASAIACVSGPPLKALPVPALPGRVVFQGADAQGDGQLYLFDFASKQQTQISQTWGLFKPINAQFSPDGRFVVFAAKNGSGASAVEDVYVWPVGAAAPQNLTKGGASGVAVSEDPKWRFDQKAIVFKQDSNIKVMRVSIAGDKVSAFAPGALTTDGVRGTATEASAPFYTPDAKYVYFMRGANDAVAVHVLAAATGQKYEKAFSTNGTYAYYPVVRDYTTILYVGWTTGTTPHADQIIMQSPLLTGTQFLPIPLNDCDADNSDPAPVDTDYLLYSNDNATKWGARHYRPVLGAYASATAWDLSRIGLGVGVGGDILGMNYTAAR